MSVRKNRLERQFYETIYSDTVVVPNILLRHHVDLEISESELIILLQIIAAKPKGQNTFTTADITAYFDGKPIDHNIERVLQDKNLVSQVTSSEQEEQFTYSLSPLYDRLLEMWAYLRSNLPGVSKASTVQSKSTTNISKLYRLFQEEFGRPLSPKEDEQLVAWVDEDKVPADILEEALKRAALQGKRTFAYVDAILRRWQQEGISTLEKIKESDNHFDGSKTKAKNHTAFAGSKSKPATSKKTSYNQVYSKSSSAFDADLPEGE